MRNRNGNEANAANEANQFNNQETIVNVEAGGQSKALDCFQASKCDGCRRDPASCVIACKHLNRKPKAYDEVYY